MTIRSTIASFGRTALNTAVDAAEAGILEKYDVELIGAKLPAIKKAEDRQLFKNELDKIGVKTAVSKACWSREEALAAIDEIGLPVMMRSGFSLGGQGSAVVRTQAEVAPALDRAFTTTDQVLDDLLLVRPELPVAVDLLQGVVETL